MTEMQPLASKPQISPAAPAPIILRTEKIIKVYPGTVALDQVDFKVYRGKVNVLIGENGAGKSTLMKILSGVEEATAGKIFLEGQEASIRSPSEALQLGIGIIYQEMGLFPNLDVTENIFMARDLTRAGGLIDRSKEDAITLALMRRLEQSITPRQLVQDLRLGQQQIIEIARALSEQVRILIMDEPTSALSTSDVAILFRIIGELKIAGVSIIYISHRLEELMQIGDYVTVLRDGKLVAEAPTPTVSVSWIIEKMVGRNPAHLYAMHDQSIGEELLRVENLSLPRSGGGYTLDSITFTLHRGEILGIYGLMGAGRSELMETIIGLHPESTGSLSLNGHSIGKKTAPDRIALGIALIPEDRLLEGLVPTQSVADNILLSSLRKMMRGFYLSGKKEAASVKDLIDRLSLKVHSPQQIVTSLSGGNQQKVIIAKGLLTEPKVLLMDEPTRGIDVGAKAEIFKIMSHLASQRLGILFVSSELDEVMNMADRILVMSKGKITGEFQKGEATEESLVSASSKGHGKNAMVKTNGGEHENL